MGSGAGAAVASTTAGLLRYWAAVSPGHTALRRDADQLDYAGLDARSNQVAQALLASGVGPGDRVAYLDKNSLEQVELYFGAVKVGAVPTPINYRLAPPEIAYIVADAGAKVLAVGSELLPAVEAVEDDLAVATLLVIGNEVAGGRHTYAGWRDAFPPDDPQLPIEASDVAYQMYSSGTTGRPKGVLLTHANLVAEIAAVSDIGRFGPGAVSLVAMPLFHIGGGGYLLGGLAHGATNVLVRDIVPADLVETFEAERVTHCFVVPAVIQAMLGVPGVADRDFSSLQRLVYGASPISERVLADALRTFGAPLVQVYGLTETTGAVVYLPPEDHDPDGPRKHRLRSAGLPVAGVELRVVDPTTGVGLPTGEVGEVWVRAPMVMQGYWHLPDATSEAIAEGGWLRTGDLGHLDADGYLYLYDRLKDMIVSGGENIYPAEVENVLMSHPAVADAAVIGVPDERWGERPLAILVRRPSGDPGAGGPGAGDDELLAWCRARLAGFKCPDRLVWVDALPRNPSGKVLRKQLRTPYWQDRARRVG